MQGVYIHVRVLCLAQQQAAGGWNDEHWLSGSCILLCLLTLCQWCWFVLLLWMHGDVM